MAEVRWDGVAVCSCGKTTTVGFTGEVRDPHTDNVTNITTGIPHDWIKKVHRGYGVTPEVEYLCKDCWDPE